MKVSRKILEKYSNYWVTFIETFVKKLKRDCELIFFLFRYSFISVNCSTSTSNDEYDTCKLKQYLTFVYLNRR